LAFAIAVHFFTVYISWYRNEAFSVLGKTVSWIAIDTPSSLIAAFAKDTDSLTLSLTVFKEVVRTFNTNSILVLHTIRVYANFDLRVILRAGRNTLLTDVGRRNSNDCLTVAVQRLKIRTTLSARSIRVGSHAVRP
jgi:hypothetical protein